MNWQFWAELLVRSGVVLLVAEGLRRIVRRTDGARRHRVVLLALGMVALLPLLSALLPAIPIGNLFGSRAIVSVELGPFVAANRSPAHASGSKIDWLLLAWSTGAAIGLAWLAAGQVAIWRLARRGVRFSVCGGTFRRLPEILLLDKPIVPMTFGIFRPKILLPSSCAEWTELRWRVVLFHELAHIKRRDVAAQLFANLTCALWWFQPLVWRTRRALRQESERACDVQAISFGLRPSEYAAELLAISRASQVPRITHCAAIGMAGAQLEARLHTILGPEPARPSRVRAFLAILMLLVFATTTSAIQTGDSPMKRTILSALLASASLSAATIGGTVLDPSGAAIPDANILLINPENSAQQQATSAADGKFSFGDLAAGQYILRVEKPGFADLFREYTVKQDATVARAMVMGATMPPKAIRVNGQIEASNVITKVNPVYPPAAKAARVQGTVSIQATISTDGTPTELTVLSSPSDELSQSALDAVRQWRYRPTLLNGEPVEIITDIRVTYQLEP